MQVTPVSAEALTELLMGFVHQLKRLGESRTLELISSLEVSVSQICLLFILDVSDHDPAVHELAERLTLSVAATGRAVDGLVKAGMVTRREDEHDRRVKRVSLAPAGEKLIAQVTEADKAAMGAFSALLTDDERSSLFHALAPILARSDFTKRQETREDG
jgi:DNA-binding MarR family transcriptional regulator